MGDPSQSHIVADRDTGVGLIDLADDSDESRPLDRPHRLGVAPEQEDLARRGRLQSGEKAQQRCLSGAVGTYDGEPIALSNVNGNIP
jgi:hypothetical protein